MGKVRELYESRVKPMVPAERLQLARLILDDLAGSGDTIDVSDEWGEDDLAELSAHATRHADRSAGSAGGTTDEPR